MAENVWKDWLIDFQNGPLGTALTYCFLMTVFMILMYGIVLPITLLSSPGLLISVAFGLMVLIMCAPCICTYYIIDYLIPNNNKPEPFTKRKN